MILWATFRIGELAITVRIPELETEHAAWQIEFTVGDKVLRELTIPMVWVPRFGVDAGDDAAMQVACERVERELNDSGQVETLGLTPIYEAGPGSQTTSDPVRAATGYHLLQEAKGAVDRLGVRWETVATAFGFPPAPLHAVLPVALTPPRRQRLSQLVVLAQLVEQHPELGADRDALVGALARDDFAEMRRLVDQRGVVPPSIDPAE